MTFQHGRTFYLTKIADFQSFEGLHTLRMIKNQNFFINFIKIRELQKLQLILARNLHRDKAYIAQGFECDYLVYFRDLKRFYRVFGGILRGSEDFQRNPTAGLPESP